MRKPSGSDRHEHTRAVIAADWFTDEPNRRLRWVATGLLYLVLANLVAIAAFLGATARAQAAGAVAARSRLRDPRRDALRRAAAEERQRPLRRGPLVGTDVDLVVSGPTARARVTQIFHNPTDGWVEAVYVYPLPEGGAVDTLKMVVGDRIIVADVKERKIAREVYERAKSAGQKAGLIEQERPNIFTNSSPISDRARPSSSRSSTRRRYGSPGTNSRCACRW